MFSKKNTDIAHLKPILLNDNVIEYTTSICYLGTTVISDNGLKFPAAEDLHKFYRAANAILTVLHKPNEQILLQLLYSNCIPIINFASSVKTNSASETRDCDTAINDAIRKIFSFNRWESVRHLRESFGYKSIYKLFS